MPDYFRVVAVDFDGTLTTSGRPSAEVLDAIGRARQGGRRVLLVTGRILSELRESFSEVDEVFDAVVAENGAVIAGPMGTRQLREPIDTRIARELERNGHHIRRGKVLLACRAGADSDALAVIRRLGLDYQLVFNRTELMILPSGITKGTGVATALASLGLSPHSTVGIGDAENDHSLLDRCELGVAVANAVDSLKSHADLVLDQPDGEGVAAFLAGPVLAGTRRIHPSRWHITLGTTADGDCVSIPASQINVLIAGASRSGKSYVTGLFAERLIDLDYSVVLVDPEGDHTNLGRLPGVVVVGGSEPLPDLDHLGQLLASHHGSVVIDLSQLSAEAKDTYYRTAPPRFEALRVNSGLPHWLFVDEAHEQFGRDVLSVYTPSRKGHCLVTHRPAELCDEANGDLDVLIAMPRGSGGTDDAALEALVAFTDLDRGVLATWLAGLSDGQAVLVRSEARHDLIPFQPAGRRTSHVRHWHRYVDGQLDWHHRFIFTRHDLQPSGEVAANLNEFHRELLRCDRTVISHHARRGDFSRWIDSVLRDDVLATEFRAGEGALRAGPDADPDEVRNLLLDALEARYIG